jgi:O-antigen/teichoic acid export membrane protein
VYSETKSVGPQEGANTIEVNAEPNSWSQRVIVRFGTTFLANMLRSAISFASGILIARGLGASAYGDLNFLLASFLAIGQLFDLGTSSAFYTFIAKKRRGWSFALLYLGWMAFQFLACFAVLALLLPAHMIDRVWIGHGRAIVLLAFLSSFLTNQLWGMFSQLGEAARKTVVIQVASVIQAVVHFGLIAVVMYLRWLTIPLVMWLLVVEYLLLVLVLGPGLMKQNIAEHSTDDYATAIREFVVYCSPLVIYGWFGFLYSFADRWFLQQFGGAEQQGFFSIGAQIANISLIATASILRVFWKEIAEAREREDHQRVRRLYVSVYRSLYFFGASISCLLIPFSREILIRTVGINYERAWPCLALMLVYPLHQSLGQIQSTLFYASEQTKSFARIGLLMMGVSVPITYFLLAPRAAVVPGLGLGAVGLAIKMVVLGIVGVNLQGYVIARSNTWPFDYAYQAIALGVLLCFGWVAKWLSVEAFAATGSIGNGLAVMLLSGVLYLGFLGPLLYLRPSIAGFTREDAKHALGGTLRWWRSVRA